MAVSMAAREAVGPTRADGACVQQPAASATARQYWPQTVMRRVHNYFERERVEGVFTVAGGVLEPMPDAPYIAVSGSRWHDGVCPAGALPEADRSEVFTGTVWGLHPPADFLALCGEISDYAQKHPVGAPRSESFGAYRYEASPEGWEAAFAGRLAPFRRMFTEVNV